jgi:membrane protease YdiL (CAAX protease family)
MWALRYPASAATLPSFFESGGARIVGVCCAAAAAVASIGVLPGAVAAVVGVAAIHGGLIAVALVWSGVTPAAASIVIVLLALARALVAIGPLGALAYLAVPVWLALLANNGQLKRLALRPPWPWGATAVGALAGSALALHLFACASRTLGYGIRFEPVTFLAAIGYDLGANVISGELFFRGALLQHLWRRWSFGLALAGATSAATLRYCLDPFVATAELRIGAAVYMTLLAVLNGALYRWSGSLLPGLAAGLVFFACYRLLGAT